MVTLTRQQVREVDRLAIQELGIPGVVLMENAGRNAAGIVLQRLEERSAQTGQLGTVSVVCGGGNNGGDGYVIARHLHNRGVEVKIYAITDPATLSGDAAVHHRICEKMRMLIEPITTQTQLLDTATSWGRAPVLVDALLGTGFQGAVRDHPAAVITAVNGVKTKYGTWILAIDVPSGLDCDTGLPSNATVRADATVTFVASKSGFTNPAARPYTGRVHIADVGAPPGLIDRVLENL